MSSDEAKRIVSAGLERRKAARKEAEQEARLEQYEQDMIETCNKSCADAKEQRRLDDAGRLTRVQAEARRAARMEARAKEQAREDAATAAVKRYILICMAIFWLTAFTNLPVWAAITLSLGLAVFPVVYIFRLYFPVATAQGAEK